MTQITSDKKGVLKSFLEESLFNKVVGLIALRSYFPLSSKTF